MEEREVSVAIWRFQMRTPLTLEGTHIRMDLRQKRTEDKTIITRVKQKILNVQGIWS